MADAVFSTFVFRHKSEADARRVFSAIMRRWPFTDKRRTVTSAWSAGDATSVTDAVRLALECRVIDAHEQKELALDLLEADTWGQCLAKFAEWELTEVDGELVEVAES